LPEAVLKGDLFHFELFSHWAGFAIICRMERIEREVESGGDEERGVLGVTEENGHYAVHIRWKDGKESVRHFPVQGVEVWDVEKHVRLGRLSGDRMVNILKDVSADRCEGELEWKDFLGDAKNGGKRA